ncbi:MAG: GNAT family N-acetyltransferase [Fusobacteriota bacterium]
MEEKVKIRYGNFDDAYEVRKEVFVKGQGISEDIEKDEYDKTSKHLVIYKNDNPIATGRIVKKDGEYSIGRVAVKKQHRKNNYGKLIMENLINKTFDMGAEYIDIHAQKSVELFYKKLGFKSYGDCFLEADIEHISMKLTKNKWEEYNNGK